MSRAGKCGIDTAFLRVSALDMVHIVCVSSDITRRANAYLVTFLRHHVGDDFTISQAECTSALIPLTREETKAIHLRFLHNFNSGCDREEAVRTFFAEMCEKGSALRV